jgi:hypothetical protein
MLRRALASASLAFALSLLTSADATAIAQRTFVASNGNDAHPCSLTLPCRAFAAAIAQTIGGGEVIVLDSAGYGPVTITQSISIIAPAGVYAGIFVPGGQTGVHINTANIKVALRGLTINSASGVGTGIWMQNGSELAVESCAISNFIGGHGILIETAAVVSISAVAFNNNQNVVQAGFGATVHISNSQFFGTTFEGVVLSGGTSGTTYISITDSQFTGIGLSGFAYCIDNEASAGTVGNMSVTRVTVSGCAKGINNAPNSGATGTMTVSNSVLIGNDVGFSRGGGTFWSLGTSQVTANLINTAGTITSIGGQ